MIERERGGSGHARAVRRFDASAPYWVRIQYRRAGAKPASGRRSANKATSLIIYIESEVAAVNRDLLYVPISTVLSLDDDHLCMASRAVSQLSFLQQHKNPKKGLGPVENTLGSALIPFFYACYFTRCVEKLVHTWEHLVQLLQGASTTGALRPMAEANFAADRGYNSKETIKFVCTTLSPTILGTHKRDLTYPYVFGSGPISRRSRGMVVPERGCRAVCIATKKWEGPARRVGRSLEACLYRESRSCGHDSQQYEAIQFTQLYHCPPQSFLL